MHHVVFVGILQGRGDVVRYADGLGEGDGSLSGQPLVDRLALHIGHDIIKE
jgi:hypothetical protein